MKSSFGEALESFLNARDHMKTVFNDANSSQFSRSFAVDVYDDKFRLLEEAHKLSLLDVIAGENHEETQ